MAHDWVYHPPIKLCLIVDPVWRNTSKTKYPNTRVSLHFFFHLMFRPMKINSTRTSTKKCGISTNRSKDYVLKCLKTWTMIVNHSCRCLWMHRQHQNNKHTTNTPSKLICFGLRNYTSLLTADDPRDACACEWVQTDIAQGLLLFRVYIHTLQRSASNCVADEHVELSVKRVWAIMKFSFPLTSYWWWWAFHCPSVFRISSSDEELLSAAAWYQEGLPRQICEEYLSEDHQSIGSFILRQSSSYPRCPFVLSVRTRLSLVEHFLIERTDDHRAYRLQVCPYDIKERRNFIDVVFARVLRKCLRSWAHWLFIIQWSGMFFLWHLYCRACLFIPHRHLPMIIVQCYEHHHRVFVLCGSSLLF